MQNGVPPARSGKARFERVQRPSGFSEKRRYEFRYDPVRAEHEIEEWLISNFEQLRLDAALIGTQIDLGRSKKPDMLCIDRLGNFGIVEIKRDRTSYEILVQVFEYAHLLTSAQPDGIKGQWGGAAELYQQQFRKTLPARAVSTPFFVLVVPEMSNELRDLVGFLNQRHNFSIGVVTFRPTGKKAPGFLLKQEVVLPAAKPLNRAPLPARTVALRFAETSAILWQDCIDRALIAVPSSALAELQEMARHGPVRIAVDLIGSGYVGIGILQSATELEGPVTGETVLLPIKWSITLAAADAIHHLHLPRFSAPLQHFTDADAWDSLVEGLLAAGSD